MTIGANKRPQGTFDAELEFKDAGLVAASAAATVDSVAKIVDVGTGLFRGDLVVDVTAIEVASDTEMYDVIVEGSNSATFADTIVPLATLQLGAAVANIRSADDATGRYLLPFRNERNGTAYRYLRVYVDVSGDIATGINFIAYAVPAK